MGGSKLNKLLKECGVILSTPTNNYFAFRCTKCSTQVADCPIFGRWTTFEEHVKKRHNECVNNSKNTENTKAKKAKIEFTLKEEDLHEDIVFLDDEAMTAAEEYKECEDVRQTKKQANQPYIMRTRTDSAPEELSEYAQLKLESQNDNAQSTMDSFINSNADNSTDTDADEMPSDIEEKQDEAANIDRDFSDVDGINVSRCLESKKKPMYKKICFEVANNKIAQAFLSFLLKHPTLWGYTGHNKRKSILATWIAEFKQQHRITFTSHDLQLNLKQLRNYYNSLLKSGTASDATAAYVLEQCNRLPQSVRIEKIPCEHCDKFFRAQHKYQEHLYKVHGMGESPYRCELCEKSFRQQPNYDFHMRNVHTKEFDITCEVCKRGFLTQSALTLHMPMHTGDKRYVCETCGQLFRCRKNLNLHETRMHLRQRNFACHLCTKTYYSNGLLKDHLNVHFNIKPYVCPTCDKAFHNCNALARHKEIHAEIRRYVCQLCSAAFSQRVGLRCHMKCKHKYAGKEREEEGA